VSRLALIAAALLISVGGVLVVRAVTAPAPSSAALAAALAGELRCPDCQGLSVAESRTAAADAIRREIAEQLAAARSPDEIRERFVARYGEWILLSPRDPLAWLAPALALLAGLGVLGWWLIDRRRRAAIETPPAQAAPAPAEGDRARVRDELDALDA
jgi:cytochrome c-type biogenesis protein CcmH